MIAQQLLQRDEAQASVAERLLQAVTTFWGYVSMVTAHVRCL